ncbi:MAG: class I SAM-dependent methyltransferase [Provencibacterium sp.]|jgi:SAM-dependent methyltransferase|nr:class I SAM-dependent methyltransferase [Provencibacterium sp.]
MEIKRGNPYDDAVFFEKYSQMARSRLGLEGAGEWETLKAMLPDFGGKRVLDLGCGYGWHCRYALEQGAAAVTGVDISGRMLAVAREKTKGGAVTYLQMPIEEIAFEPESFDLVFSSLALHYVCSFSDILKKIRSCLRAEGDFVFSVEHPVFTAYGTQDWIYDEEGKILHFPVDRYFEEGEREAAFLGEKVRKYHRTLTSYVEELLTNGFEILHLAEPRPPERMMEQPGMRDELRRPIFLLVAARKKPFSAEKRRG